jgi:putative endopeptidase
MHKPLFGAACACFMVGCNKAPEVPARSAAPPALLSGIDVQYIDDSVRAQDDFYKHINGKWLASTEIPADKASYGSFTKLRDDSEAQLRAIIEGLPSPAAAKEKSLNSTPASWMRRPSNVWV